MPTRQIINSKMVKFAISLSVCVVYQIFDEIIASNIYAFEENKLLKLFFYHSQYFRLDSESFRLEAVWPDLAKFHRFGKCLAIYLWFICFWAKFWTHFGTICVFLGKLPLLKMAKYWKHNMVIWSHWLETSRSVQP